MLLKLFFDGLLFKNILLKYRGLLYLGFPGGSDGKESTCKVGDLGSIPGLERSLAGEEYGYPLQYCGLENSMDRGAQEAIVHRLAKSRTGLSD